MECADTWHETYSGALAWRNANRTVGVLLRRGWIIEMGSVVLITDNGREALAQQTVAA
jgi:2-keto-4-pentenoate hydratase